MTRPFYFRLNPSQLLAELIQIPEDKRGSWTVQLLIDLTSGNPTTSIAEQLMQEASNYSETKRIAAKKRWDAKQCNSMHMHTSAMQNDAPPMHSNASNSNSNKKTYRDNIKLTDKEFDTLVNKHGIQFVEKCLDKLSSYKMANGKEYKSDYGAINQWVVEAVLKSLPQNKPTPATNPLCVTPEWL